MIGDWHLRGDLIVEECDASDDPSGFEPVMTVTGKTKAEIVAAVIDPTAALGTPEVIYRRHPGESVAEAADRLNADVMKTAHDVLRVLGLSDEP